MGKRMVYRDIDFDVLKRTYGEEFCEQLKKLNVEQFFDINDYMAKTKGCACVSSIWKYSSGGSFDFEIKELGRVHIHNGTLLSINGISVPFGDRYYKDHLGYEILGSKTYTKSFFVL